MNRRGFTLVEIMVVVVILGILAVLIVPRVLGRTDEARAAAAKHDVATLMQSLKLYKLDNGRYPSNEEGLAALVSPPAGLQNWHGPYIKRGVPNDPWGAPYVYRFPGSHNAGGYDLMSMGSDGREGNDDITNWTK